MLMANHKPAPKFLNLFLIKLPPGGVASIAHRVSGVVMFVFLPLIAWLFGRSLESAQAYAAVLAWLQSTPVKVLSLLLVWSLSHHLLAGVRHLLLDIDVGTRMPQARISAHIVNLGAVALTVLYLAWLL
jgi:succinate dehydrogenase / fumarate reductase cytochrome b subunit